MQSRLGSLNHYRNREIYAPPKPRQNAERIPGGRASRFGAELDGKVLQHAVEAAHPWPKTSVGLIA
jgi:hypothetical protein